MNRQEVLEKLEKFYDWNYDYEDYEEYDQETERNHKQNLEDIIKYLKQPITLTDFLGWEEGVEYDYRGDRYKINDNKLYYFDCRYNEWILSIFNEDFIAFQQAEKVKPKKYYLRLKEKYCEFYGIKNNFACLNFDKEVNNFFISNPRTFLWFQTQFTLEEIEEIKKVDYVSLEQFEIVEVGEDE